MAVVIHRVTLSVLREVPLRLRRIAWVAAWREIEMRKPTDKACFGQVSELPGCNASERWASLVTAKIPVVEPVKKR